MRKALILSFLLTILYPGFAQTPLTEAVNIHVKTIEGETIWLFPLLDDENKIVVIDFFTTTCSYCQLYAPDFQATYEAFGENESNIYFMGINWGNDNQGVREFDSIYGLTFPTISGIQGGGNIANNDYQIASYPTVILITPDHQIVEQYIWPPTEENITDAIIAAGGEYVGIDQHGITAEETRIYPNPASQQIFLDFSLDQTVLASYEIVDFTGRVVFRSESEFYISGKNNIDISVSGLKDGLYFVRLLTNEQPLLTSRFVVVR